MSVNKGGGGTKQKQNIPFSMTVISFFFSRRCSGSAPFFTLLKYFAASRLYLIS